MSELDTKLAKEFLDVMKTVSAKTFDSKNNILKTAVAVVIDASDSITPTIRLLNSPDDGSQDFEILNMSGESLSDGDAVWVNYWDGFTNAYISVKNGTYVARAHAILHKTGGADALNATDIGALPSTTTPTDIGAMPYNSISTNLLINGNFDVWQRATSQTTSGYGSDDRWLNEHVTSTKTHSRQAFTVGQTDVPHNPTYYSSTVVTTGGTAASNAAKRQRIEDVLLLSGRTVTLSFYAKASSALYLAVDASQNFGTGGSSSVTGISAEKHLLSTSWQLFDTTIEFPSVADKTIGPNSYSLIAFWFDAGSNFDARLGSLGNQSGTFDIANVQINHGSTALPFVPRNIAGELQLCQRYGLFPSSDTFYGRMISYTSNTITFLVPTPVTMRTNPTIRGTINTDYIVYNNAGTAQTGFTAGTATAVQNGVMITMTKTSHGLTDGRIGIITPNGGIDAEL